MSEFQPSPACAGSMLQAPLPAVNDAEGTAVPAGLPAVIDMHVHLFPDRIFHAIWNWFEQYGWPIRYKLYSDDVIEFLTSRGVRQMTALHYAHKPGIARSMNSYMAGVVSMHAHVTGTATVLPGEPDARDILLEGFAMGLKGVKLHAHVQCFDMTWDRMTPIYETCNEMKQPIIMHVGREPKSPAYKCDPHELCAADKVDEVMRAFPNLRVCVPHLGADEFDAYKDLLKRHDNLWVDTTMALSRYLPGQVPDIRDWPLDRVMYGTDFPNLPYAWDRELKFIAEAGLTQSQLNGLLNSNATRFMAGAGEG